MNLFPFGHLARMLPGMALLVKRPARLALERPLSAGIKLSAALVPIRMSDALASGSTIAARSGDDGFDRHRTVRVVYLD